MKVISFKLEEDVYRVLRLVAEAQGRPVSVVVRDALERYLREMCESEYVGKYVRIYTPLTPEACRRDGGGPAVASADALRDPSARLKRLGAASLARRRLAARGLQEEGARALRVRG